MTEIFHSSAHFLQVLKQCSEQSHGHISNGLTIILKKIRSEEANLKILCNFLQF